MREDVGRQVERRKQDAERLKQRAESLETDPELQEEWIRQDNLIYAGLMGVGIVMVQPFLTAESLDRSATICVVSWSVAIPLLAGLLMVNRQESFRRRRTTSRTVVAVRPVALLAACVGLVAGFWHIHWIAGVAVLVSALVATGVHSAGFSRLELGATPAGQQADRNAKAPASEQAEDPGRTEDPGDTPPEPLA
ncbi:MAG TPA: hypothetical protein VFZ85_14975 [Jiangellaceae bacterium]